MVGYALIAKLDLHDQLADVVAVEQHVDASGRLLQTLDDRVPVLDLALRRPSCAELRDRLREAAELVEDDEALDRHTVHQHPGEVGPAAASSLYSEISPQSGDAGVQVQHPEDLVHDLAADVLEVDVDAIRAGLRAAARANRSRGGRWRRRSRARPPARRTCPRRRRCRRRARRCSFASWPATEPTAPAAADTTTVSPSWGLPISSMPELGRHAR